MLIFISVVLGLALVLDMPGCSGRLPDAKFSQDLQQSVFVGVSGWPRLMKNVRRRGGDGHDDDRGGDPAVRPSLRRGNAHDPRGCSPRSDCSLTL
jgi:hypothetical protein